MKIRKVTIEPKSDTLTPCLVVYVEVESEYQTEGLISICGTLKVDGKILCELNETLKGYNNLNYNILLNLSDDQKQIMIKNNSNPINYTATMPAFLSPKAIEHIERKREKNAQKSIEFQMEFIVKYLRNPVINEYSNNISALANQIITENQYETFTINQSDWTQKYTKPLGIGDFILLELKLPENGNIQIPVFWVELYNKLSENVANMHKYIVLGDWENTMFHARKFLENARLGSNLSAIQPFQTAFTELMTSNNHSQQGIDNFYEGIRKFFDFMSKYIHDRNQAGQIVPTPICKKEDAYFAYTLAVGLLSFIGNKISEN